MTKYAAQTEVAPGASRDEIERTLARYGATQFAYGWQADRAMVGFVMHDRQVRFVLPMPDRNAHQFTRTETGRERKPAAASAAFEQATKQRWRALALVIKAKLEAVETGIVSFESEFGMHMMLPDGRTAAEHVLPAIEAAYTTGSVPPMIALEQ